MKVISLGRCFIDDWGHI